MKKHLKVQNLKHPAGYSVGVFGQIAKDSPYIYVVALESFQFIFSNGTSPIPVAIIGQVDLCQKGNLIYEVYGKRSDHTGIV